MTCACFVALRRTYVVKAAAKYGQQPRLYSDIAYFWANIFWLTRVGFFGIPPKWAAVSAFFTADSAPPVLTSPTVRFLYLVKPFLPFLPEVSSPDRKVRVRAPGRRSSTLTHSPPDSLQPEAAMDRRHAAYLPCLLASPAVRYHVL